MKLNPNSVVEKCVGAGEPANDPWEMKSCNVASVPFSH